MARSKDKNERSSAGSYASALGRAGSGAVDVGRGAGTLALLATRDAVVLGRAGLNKTLAVRTARVATRPVRSTKTRNRLIAGGVLVTLLAAGGFAFRWLRSQNEQPEPAAAPPSVHDVSTNGSAPARTDATAKGAQPR
ncbi:hypothetical protein OG921_17850 [Aldersonia sp. NBC_00410]|uniref:hypothetical protein n=1 Tax=Aldersonia sp. NBC_00410 TaxID=2975954 RepID=UPI0022543CAB|nr:hypothetical protein [Aldersonia sp. NBC_00410]MCX5045033.1 hypothetical protein [Aldersonia sp. NBC_00410]